MPGASPGFVHLHVHSSYSLLEGALTIARLAELAKKDRQPALALTDTDNMFGALEFSEKLASVGIQPIIGCALGIDFGDQDNRSASMGESFPRVVLLAAREDGYRSLMRLCSRAYLDTAQTERPHVKLDWLADETGGLIALSGGPGGPLDAAIGGGQSALALSRCEHLQRLFGDRLYIELQRHGTSAERLAAPGLIELAYTRGISLVASNEPVFATREDYEAHDALLCIAGGKLVADGDRRQLTTEHRFKTRAEMAALFADLPEALAATVEIAERCNFRPRTLAPILPRFTASANGNEAPHSEAAKAANAAVKEAEEAGEARALREAAYAGLDRRLARQPPAPGQTVENYRDRLDFELSVIGRMKYSGYFLIVADFIQWAKAQGIPVGPGRGSGAGSLVAYSLTITDLDPIRFGLLFERFLNPERISMPDFDVDFCQNRRDEVVRYVQQRYGQDRVAQIITFGTLQARGVLRDVGRVLQMPYGQVDKLCKLVPQNPANPVTLARSRTSRDCRPNAIAIR
jgi:DNA polymerase III subunit alpha